jgi:hypothetical protein
MSVSALQVLALDRGSLYGFLHQQFSLSLELLLVRELVDFTQQGTLPYARLAYERE